MKRRMLIRAIIVGVGLLGSAMVLPATAQLRGEEPGSFLIFPEFNIAPPAATQLRITDVSDPALGGTRFIRINYICPGTPGTGVCATLTSNEITTFRGTLVLDVATELGPNPPCVNGYIVAYVQDINHTPIAENAIIGSYRITDDPGIENEAANAIAVQSAKAPGTPLGASGVLTFGPTPTKKVKPAQAPDYVQLPNTLLSDFQAVNVAAGTRTQLIVLTPTIAAGLANPTANISVQFWNQFEDEHSTSKQFTCWAKFPLETISGLFTTVGLGTPVGSMQVNSITVGNYSPAILGVIREVRETGVGPTLRRMYHSGAISSSYDPL